MVQCIHMIKTNDYPMLTAFAISTLESAYNAKYNGTITVREMCTDLVSAMMWEGESPDKVYHRFKSNDNTPNNIVSDDELFQVANHHAPN